MNDLIQEPARQSSRLTEDEVKIEPLQKGGSGRKFYRLAIGPASAERGNSIILVRYSDAREENQHYFDVAHFLSGIGVNVPRMYFHDPDQGLLWMEDLGDIDLYSQRDQPWTERFPMYQCAIEQLVLLHNRAPLNPSKLKLQIQFDADLYKWEQEYFFMNCLQRHFGLDRAQIDQSCDRDALTKIADQLAAEPRVLVHRDFQSQNVLVLRGDSAKIHRCFLIDFQGLRPGLRQYDLASLVYDPYAKLDAAQRAELIDEYTTRARDEGAELDANFATILDLCAAQRLMQALGAYGYLSHVNDRAYFLNHIPTALRSLKEVLARIPGLENLRDLLGGASFQPAS
ncbi:MAG: phosphotransferase [Verrucomicrobiota bacterium]|nr:phosphotransferase [Verrucomicrobiota bacterium]